MLGYLGQISLFGSNQIQGFNKNGAIFSTPGKGGGNDLLAKKQAEMYRGKIKRDNKEQATLNRKQTAY